MRRVSRFVVLVMLTQCSHVQAQAWQSMMDNTEPFVGSGSARIQRPAARMLAVIPLRASGSDIREATAALQKTIGEAKAKLQELSVEENSVSVSAFAVNNETADTSRRMMMRMRSSSSGGTLGEATAKAGKEAAAPVITVAASLHGEWKLVGVDGPDILATSWELQEAIRGVKLSGDDAAEELSPEEKEMLEEAQMFDNSGSDENSTEPVFIFLGEVTKEERAALMKEAFAKAAADAREMAESTGSMLGRLGSVRTAGTNWEGYTPDYSRTNYQLVTKTTQELNSAGNSLQMIGESPAELTYSVSISAGFHKGE